MANAESTEIVGHCAEHAKEIIDVDYPIERFSNQEDGWAREVRVRRWRALEIKLAVGNALDGERDMLLKMQQNIAVSTHALRSPCAQGMELDTIADHFPRCDQVARARVEGDAAG